MGKKKIREIGGQNFCDREKKALKIRKQKA